MFEQPAPACAGGTHQFHGGGGPAAQQFDAGNLFGFLVQWQLALEKFLQRIHQADLVLQRQFDVDALDPVGILAQALQGYDHVLVDLERVRMLRNGRGAGPVEPELLARFRGYRDEAFATARVGDSYDSRRSFSHRLVVLADDVGQQHHFRPAAALGLGRIANCLDVALVQMLEPGEDRSARLEVQMCLDLDDGWNGLPDLAVELEAHGAGMRGHLVQDEARRGDDAVAALLLHARQAGEEFVRDVLAQAFLAEFPSRDLQDLRFGARHAPILAEAGHTKTRHLRIVDLAQVVADALDQHPLGIRRDHFPGSQVVDGRAPQHGLLAAGVHRDVAADAGRVG